MAWQASVCILTNQNHIWLLCIQCMSTLHASQIIAAVFQANIQFYLCLLWFPRIFAQFALKIFTHTCSMERVLLQYRCFLKILTTSFPMFWVKNLSSLWNYCLSWEFLSFKTVKMAKLRSAGKIHTWKIVNCYRMFAELRDSQAYGYNSCLRPVILAIS